MRADHDSLRSVAQYLLDLAPAPDSAADLHLDIGSAEDCLNLGGVVTATGNPVEVDDVEVVESILSPGDCDPNRIGYANQLLVIRAADELDTRPSSQIKRGNCDHLAGRSARARIMTGQGAVLIACWRACE